MESDLSEDNLGSEAEETLGQITGITSKGSAIEKVEPKMFRLTQRWFFN